jgi:hypothetical protein
MRDPFQWVPVTLNSKDSIKLAEPHYHELNFVNTVKL